MMVLQAPRSVAQGGKMVGWLESIRYRWVGVAHLVGVGTLAGCRKLGGGGLLIEG